MTQFLLRSMIAAGLVAAAGCYAEGPGPQYAEDDGSGDLVEVSPGVEVIADWDEPIFFVDGFYWVSRGGFWYRSGWYRGGWERAESVPAGVSGIVHPEGYAHYRPAGWVGHGPMHGGYEAHAQYHASHPVGGGVRVRAAVHGGRR